MILTALITHLDAPRVRRQLDYLRELAPDSRFVVCHGGSRADFERLEIDDAVFVDDPSLRGPPAQQSYTQVLAAVYESFVRDDPAIDLVYFVEYDQLVLRGDFEEALLSLADRSPAGLFGKHASPRNDTNWPHLARVRQDARLNRFVAAISRRDDPAVRFGCLGTGMLFRREALAAFCSVVDPPHAYLELFVPTVVYHLGFEVVDVDALGDLYASVRWRPEYSVDEALAAKRAGRAFIHPFKELDLLDAVRAAPARQRGQPTVSR